MTTFSVRKGSVKSTRFMSMKKPKKKKPLFKKATAKEKSFLRSVDRTSMKIGRSMFK